MFGNIFPFKKKASSNLDIRLEAPVPDFVPYACHYDPSTILTKNGELLQVIKITGFFNEKIGQTQVDLRDVIKKSVLENIKTDDYALWFHTIRRKQSLDPGGDFTPGFAIQLDQVWSERNNWKNQYVNEVYVSVIRGGIRLADVSVPNVLGSVFFSALKRRHNNFLKRASEELNYVVDGMLRILGEYGAVRLGVVERKDGYYSEPLKFFSKILNLAETDIRVPLRDLSEYLVTHQIAFGFNTMEVRGATGKHFGAMFTIKEAREIPAHVIDRFLQLPQEFIISQTLDFINSKHALREFKQQYYYLNVSGAESFAEDIGIKDIVLSDTGSVTDFGESQTTIFLIDDNLAQLETNIRDATEALKTMGIVASRRDLRMEECFWAQLPGNFVHISRRKAINTARAAALASLYNFPAGNKSGNLWGTAVTAFHTAKGTPYFFNFHVEDNGHTVIIGPFGSGKTVLMNFLVAQSRKYNGKLYFFDQMRASKVFIKSINGNYTIIKPRIKNPEYAFSPFTMEDTPLNRSFLKQWMVYLAEACGIKTTEAEIIHLGKLVDYLYELPKEMRKLSSLAGKFGGSGVINLELRMSSWHGDGEYAHIFDNVSADVTEFEDVVYGFGMSFLLEDQVCSIPALSYLLHQIEMKLDGRPTTIVLDEAWNLINNPIFAPKIANWLERMRNKNTMVIFASENIKNASSSELTDKIASKIGTQIFLPNVKAEESSIAYREVWGLSEAEYRMLAAMSVDKRQFMLRQKDISIVAVLNLSGMKELDVLSGSDKTVKIMDDAIARVGNNPEDWLPLFYQSMQDLRGERTSKEVETDKLFVM